MADLELKDWKAAKYKIEHFDQILVRMRLYAIPIAIGVFVMGLTAYQFHYTVQVSILSMTVSGTSLILMAGSIYLTAIFALDIFYYWLLRRAIKRAEAIERMPKYRNKLRMTTAITSSKLMFIQTLVATIVYILLIIFGFSLALNIVN